MYSLGPVPVRPGQGGQGAKRARDDEDAARP